MSLRVGIPSIGMRSAGTVYQRMELAAREAARRNNAALWYVGSDPNGWVYEDSTGTTAATGTDPVGLLLDRSYVAGESYGSNIVTNGDFSNGTTSWTATGGATQAVVSGELVVTNTAGGGTEQVVQDVFSSIVAGKTYKVTITGRKGTSSSFQIGIEGNSVSYYFSGALTNTVAETRSFTFTAEAGQTVCIVKLRVLGIGTSIFDNISVQEAIGNLGPELSSNPGPFTVTTGYSTVGGTGTFSVSGGDLLLTNTASNTGLNAPTFTTVVGQYYKFVLTIPATSGSTVTAYLRDANNVAPDILGGTVVAVGQTLSYVFQANTVATQFRGFSTGASGTITRISVASLKQLLGYPALQATSGNRPTLELQANGYYGMRFDGVNDTLSTAIVAASTGNTTIYALSQLSYSAYLGGFFNNPEGQYMTTGATSVSVNDNVNASAGITGITSTNTFGVPAVLTGATRSGSQKVWKNGTLANATTAAIAPSTAASSLYGIAVAGVTLPAAYKQGLYFLVCVGPASMPDADRIAIERFAALLSGASYV